MMKQVDKIIHDIVNNIMPESSQELQDKYSERLFFLYALTLISICEAKNQNIDELLDLVIRFEKRYLDESLSYLELFLDISEYNLITIISIISFNLAAFSIEDNTIQNLAILLLEYFEGLLDGFDLEKNMTQMGKDVLSEIRMDLQYASGKRTEQSIRLHNYLLFLK